jgi:hypothetical protein
METFFMWFAVHYWFRPNAGLRSFETSTLSTDDGQSFLQVKHNAF